MSIFTKSLKTFKSDILGEEKEFKINLAIQANLKSDHGLTVKDLSAEDVSDTDVAKFVHATLKANGMETSLEDIMDNVAPYELFEFMTSYNMVNNENFTLATNRLKDKSEQKKKQEKVTPIKK